jgi:hypothetical protein
LEHRLALVLGVWLVEQPDVPILQLVRLPSERVHLLSKHLAGDRVMTRERIPW